MLPIIHPQELASLQSKDIVLIDTSNGKDARANYGKKHLMGALFVDMNTQLATIHDDVAIGGRHPLPTLEQFSKTLSQLGITKESHVIIYDDKQGANAAARFWWMLMAIGHNKVQVLNGGLQAAEQIGYPTDDGVVTPKQVKLYVISGWQLPLADMQEVETKAGSSDSIVIDVREEQRYNGITEPIDLVAGHIPGAINVPYSLNLDAQGLFLSPGILKANYRDILKAIPSSRCIVHCGSGVTACHTLLAMTYAGIQIPKLYVGSWSEWSRNSKPIASLK